MPKAPDFLLGFGFEARDKGMMKYLEDTKKALEGVQEGLASVTDSSVSTPKVSAGSDFVDQLTEATTRASKATKKQTETVSEQLQRLKEFTKGYEGNVKNVEAGLASITKNLGEASKVAKKSIVTLSKKAQADLEKFFKLVDRGGHHATTALEQIPAVLAGIPNVTTDVKNELLKLHEGLRTGEVSTADATQAFRKHKQALIDAGRGYEFIKKEQKSIMPTFDKLIHGEGIMEQSLSQRFPKISKLLGSWKKLPGLAKKAGEAVGSGLKDAPKIPDGYDPLQDMQNKLSGDLSDSRGSSDSDDLEDTVRSSFSSINKLKAVIDGLDPSVRDSLGASQKHFKDFNEFLNAFSKNEFLDTVLRYREDIKLIGDAFDTHVTKAGENSFEKIIQKKEWFVDLMKSNFRDMVADIQTKLSGMSTSAVDEFSQLESMATTSLQGIGERLEATLRETNNAIAQSFAVTSKKIEGSVENISEYSPGEESSIITPGSSEFENTLQDLISSLSSPSAETQVSAGSAMGPVDPVVQALQSLGDKSDLNASQIVSALQTLKGGGKTKIVGGDLKVDSDELGGAMSGKASLLDSIAGYFF